jgi:diketogulonate reductase-like aldo/keto reductase
MQILQPSCLVIGGAGISLQVLQSFARSLKHMEGLEYIDSLVLHSPLRTLEQAGGTILQVIALFHSASYG